MSRLTTLPTDSQERKEYGLASFLDDYFPAALAGVARHSFKAGAKHTGGLPRHKRWLSNDHRDTLRRHLMDLGDLLWAVEREYARTGGVQVEAARALLDEANAIAWRALALSQELHERFGDAPLAPAARLSEADYA